MTAIKRERRDRRDEVHGAAIAVFCAKGFAAASMQDVADAVGVLKGSLYHYVASKDELLERIFAAAAQASGLRMEAVAALDADPVGRLRAFVEGEVGWDLEHHEHATVLRREWPYLQGEWRAIVVGHREVYESFVRGLISDCVGAGVTQPGLDATHAPRFVLGALDATPEWYRPSGADPPGHVARVYADMTLGAVLGTAPRREGMG